MARGLFAGDTDYSHQSLQDMIDDIEDEQRNITEFLQVIENNIQIVTDSGYWISKVQVDFRNIVAYSVKHYQTTKIELTEIAKEIKDEVQNHHINRLKRITVVASDINIRIGKIWHQDYERKEYGNSDFAFVEKIYGDTRDMAVNLLDMTNIAERLQDFIGKSNYSNRMKKNNPWISGSFYLFLAIVTITGLAVLAKSVSWVLLPIIIIGGILLIGIIGAFQLKNDDKLKDESFLKLITETYKRLPLLKNASSKKK
jgi:hypothetical protein